VYSLASTERSETVPPSKRQRIDLTDDEGRTISLTRWNEKTEPTPVLQEKITATVVTVGKYKQTNVINSTLSTTITVNIQR
jgi:hypothetical protein